MIIDYYHFHHQAVLLHIKHGQPWSYSGPWHPGSLLIWQPGVYHGGDQNFFSLYDDDHDNDDDDSNEDDDEDDLE